LQFAPVWFPRHGFAVDSGAYGATGLSDRYVIHTNLWGVYCIVVMGCSRLACEIASGVDIRNTTQIMYLRISLTVLALCGPLACLADTGIYAFVDDREALYLSNVPDDQRYQVLIAPVVVVSAGEETRDSPISPDYRRQYGAVVEQVAERYGIEALLLHAVIAVESGYNPKAVSKSGAAGLMQLMPATAKRYGVVDVFDPADNLRGGAQHLAALLKMFDQDLRLALAAYNAGENAVLKYGKQIPPYRETAAYVPKVVETYRRYQSSM